MQTTTEYSTTQYRSLTSSRPSAFPINGLAFVAGLMLAGLMAMLLASASSASAAQPAAPATSGATIVTGYVAPGPFIVAAQATPSIAVTGTGSAPSSTTFTQDVTVDDDRGTGSGWGLAISPIAYVPTSGQGSDPVAFSSVLLGAQAIDSPGSTDTDPADALSGPVQLASASASGTGQGQAQGQDNASGTPTVAYVAEPGTGMGNFTVALDITAQAPEGTPAGSYQPVLTVSTVTGP